MKRNLFFTLALCTAFSGFALDDPLATFEPDALDYFTNVAYNSGTNGNAEIVPNPSKTGINTTDNCLKFSTNRGIDWSNSVARVYGDMGQTIDEENRYLHVMVYTDLSGAGARIVYQSGERDDLWAYGGDEGAKQRDDFGFEKGTWKDIVFDLSKHASITELYGLYFLTTYWNGADTPADCFMYFDEMELNNDPLPRGKNYIVEASMLSDFEDGGISAAFEQTGVEFLKLAVEDNPHQEGLNMTEKCLVALTPATETAYWAGVNLSFDPVMLNDDTRYLHVLMHTNLPQFTMNIFLDGAEKWEDTYVFPAENEWFDYVLDLYNLRDSKDNAGKIIDGFRFMPETQNAAARLKAFKLDEILVNGDPTPRKADTPPTTGITAVDGPDARVYATDGSVHVKDLAGDVRIYNVAGSLVYEGISAGELNVSLDKGLYLVQANGGTVKVSVR